MTTPTAQPTAPVVIIPPPSTFPGGGGGAGGHSAPVGPAAPVAIVGPLPAAPAQRPAPGSYHAGWFDQSGYPALLPGEVRQVTLRFRNTGSAPWVKGVLGEQANLGVFGNGTPYVYPSADAFYRSVAGDAASGMSFDPAPTVVPGGGTIWSLLAADWPTPDRAAVQTEAVVPPGGLGTFTFSVRAPLIPGVYQLRLQPVIDGTVWMEDQGAFILVTTRGDYHSDWVSQSAYPTVRAGTTSPPITVTYRNSGSLDWVRGVLGEQLNLGIARDASSWSAFAAGWPTPDRVAIQTESIVPPGGTATFSFQVKAPTTPGTYVLRVRPVIDGTMWLEDQGVFVTITVVP